MTTPAPKVTPAQIAEWCHPRRSVGMPDLSEPVAATPPERLLGVWAHPGDEAYLSVDMAGAELDRKRAASVMS